jgi:hypothetical protein
VDEACTKRTEEQVTTCMVTMDCEVVVHSVKNTATSVPGLMGITSR